MFHVIVIVYLLTGVRLFVTPWTVARQAPLSMGFSRKEHWSGILFSPPGDLSDPGIEPVSLVSPASAGRFLSTEPLEKADQNRNERPLQTQAG